MGITDNKTMRSIRGSFRAWQLLRSTGIKPVNVDDYAWGELGYKSYAEYLTGEQWKEIRPRIFALFPNCIVCQNPSEQIHHLEYSLEVLAGKKDFKLVGLCRKCHVAIEFDQSGNKRTLGKANQELIRIAHKTEYGRRWFSKMMGQQKEHIERTKPIESLLLENKVPEKRKNKNLTKPVEKALTVLCVCKYVITTNKDFDYLKARHKQLSPNCGRLEKVIRKNFTDYKF